MIYFVGRIENDKDYDFLLVDTDKNSKHIYDKQRLKEFLKENKVENLELTGEKLACKQGEFSRYGVHNKTKSLTLILKENNNYIVSDNNGNIHKINENTLLREGRMYGISNAKILSTNKGVEIKTLGFKLKDIGNKNSISLDREQYYNLYKLYKKIRYGIVGDMGLGYSGVRLAFGIGIEHSSTDLERFIIAYKQIRHKINSDIDYKYTKVYSKYEISKRELKAEKVIGYLIKWKDGHEAFILRGDTPNINILDKNRMVNTNRKWIERLFIYDNYEMEIDDSIQTAKQKADGFNMHLVDELFGLIELGETIILQVNNYFKYETNKGHILTMKYKHSISSTNNRRII